MNRKIGLVFVPLLLLAAGLGVWHYRTRSTLNAEEIGRFLDVRDGLCDSDSSIYPSTERHPFPVYSPDGQYYVEIHRLWPWERRRRLIEMYEANSGDQVGRYVSSERSLLVFCWADNSTGIFVADHSPGSGSIFIGLSTRPTVRPVVKLHLRERVGSPVRVENVLVWVAEAEPLFALLAAFTTEQPGNRGTSDLVRIDLEDEQHVVNLHLRDYSFESGSTYATNVMIYGQELGMTAFTISEQPGPGSLIGRPLP